MGGLGAFSWPFGKPLENVRLCPLFVLTVFLTVDGKCDGVPHNNYHNNRVLTAVKR